MGSWGNLSARGNYAVNVGATRAYVSSGAVGPFGITNKTGFSRYIPFRSKASKITDGISKTLLMSEVRCAPGDVDDQRGAPFMEPTQGWFTAAAPPNSGTDRWNTNGSILGCNDSIFPCVGTTDSSDQWQMVVRSQHPGGANAAFCDGSVAFVPDSIDPGVWQELSTMNSGNSVGEW